jgi:hypothetical protein
VGFDATNAEGTGTRAELYVTPLPTMILLGGEVVEAAFENVGG